MQFVRSSGISCGSRISQKGASDNGHLFCIETKIRCSSKKWSIVGLAVERPNSKIFNRFVGLVAVKFFFFLSHLGG